VEIDGRVALHLQGIGAATEEARDVNGPARVISEQQGILNLQEVIAGFAVRLQTSYGYLTRQFEGHGIMTPFHLLTEAYMTSASC
jgi:hypothetical protein